MARVVKLVTVAPMTKRAYITTPIYYPTAKPHMGSAYTTMAADVYARFKRLDGYDTRFQTGTDEHGQKMQHAAEKLGMTPQAFVDEQSAAYRDLAPLLNLSDHNFIRTTEPRHYAAAQHLWSKLVDAGYIYKDSYAGWYCVADEAYYTEAELIEKDGERMAPTGRPVEWLEQESYFFKLSAFQDKLIEHYTNNPTFIQPESRRNEVMSFVKGGLEDISVSRTTINWGVPVPGDDKHVMYVWLDALTNYATGDGYPGEMPFFNEAIHLVGKDILRFHAVYWPAFLMGANEPLPKQIWAHGWLTKDGTKMGKSNNNVLDPQELINQYGIDAVRYFFLREVPFGNDGDFSHERMVQRCNTDLSNDVGNLFQRVLSMVAKNCAGQVPALGTLRTEDEALLQQAAALPALVRGHVDQLNFHKALAAIWDVVGAANKYMDTQAPWTLRKENPEQMAHVLRVLLECFRPLAVLLAPFMPASAQTLQTQLNYHVITLEELEQAGQIGLTEGTALPAPQGVFQRFELEQAA